jgi:hypothetical protein
MRTITFLLVILFASLSFAQDNVNKNGKFEKWKKPSYFRGYNIEGGHTLQDFIDFKNYGGNIFHIGIRGFLSEDAPYDTVQASITSTDLLVNFCRLSGIHYVIAVRSGPGAYDTYLESSGQTGESRIWNNVTEQQLYANMLKMIVQRYTGDSLFVGINLVVEPRPKVRFIPANISAVYKAYLENIYHIHMDSIYTRFVHQIRTVDAEIPIILESFAYSTPELFPPYTVTDRYIVYSTHNYQPVQYTRAATEFTVSYPGIYWDLTLLAQVRFDSAFMRATVLRKVRDFQLSAGVPVFLGEFGMFHPQMGGENYIKDVLSACKDYGWDFALWAWRGGSGANWNIEEFQDENHLHWKSVLKYFNAPPSPAPIMPISGVTVSGLNPVFKWDSLTSYSTYDIQVLDAANSEVQSANDLTGASWTYSGNPLSYGRTYYWHVRAKNPGGLADNISAWSAIDSFKTFSVLGITGNNGIPKVFGLHQNYPNPFNPSTKIRYDLPVSANVSITLYDVTGREVQNIYSSFTSAGFHEITFDGSCLASGVYYYSIKTGNYSDTKKMILLK